MHSFKTSFSLSAAVVAAVVGSGVAQDPTQSPASLTKGTPNVATAIHAAHGLEAVDGQVVAFGAEYKAFFNQGGIEYTPALGEKAPRNMTLRFSLESVRRGGQLLFAATAESPLPQIRGDQVTYDRGDIDEHYEVRNDGVEQSFSFDKPLGGDGDLVVRGRIDTELVAGSNPDGSISYRLAGVGGVHYGLVTGIDVHGRRVRGQIHQDGQHLELSLPDSFVDEASFPLILDPLLGTEFQVSTGDNSDPDVAYDATNNLYAVVWQNRFSTYDIDVYFQRIDTATGAVVGAANTLDFTSLTCTTPRIANVNSADSFLCVWQQAPSIFGPWDIVSRAVAAATGLRSATVLVASSVDNETNPCISGEASPTADNEALVVWKNAATGIEARQVTVSPGVDPVPFAALVAFGTTSSNSPCISKSGGLVGRHVIAWSQSGADSEINAVCVDRNLTTLGAVLVVTANTVNDTAPAVDGNGTTFVLAWQQAESTVRNNLRIEGLRYNGTTLLSNIAEVSLDSTAGQDEATPDIAFLGRKYGVVYREEVVGSPLLDDTYLQIIEGTTLELCGPRFQLDGLNGANYNYENVQRCVGQFAGTGTSLDGGIAVYGEAMDAPNFLSRVVAQRFEGVGPGGPIVNLGGGCGTLGLHDTTGGGFALGNNTFTFRCQGVAPFDVMFHSLALPVPPIACGTCTLVNPLSFLFKTNLGTGTVESVFALPCHESFLGLQMDSQWVSFNSLFPGAPCPLAIGLSASNRLRATLQL